MYVTVISDPIARANCTGCDARVQVHAYTSGRTIGHPVALDLRTRAGREWLALPTEAYEAWQCGACDKWQW